jgi:2-keto-4-pentenoate hydratase
MHMNATLGALVSEFSTEEEEAISYDLWFRAKVEQSILEANNPASPRYTTDEVMHRMDKIIKAAEAKHAAYRLV